MTSKEMKKLPKGTYGNSDLNKMFPAHCKPKGGRPEQHMYFHKGTRKDPNTGYRMVLKNRRQRRQGVTA